MENNAYFGSVRFFKHLIYITMFSILLSILLGLLFYGNNRLLALNTYAATDATKNKEAPLNETNISNEREAKNSASDTEDIKISRNRKIHLHLSILNLKTITHLLIIN